MTEINITSLVESENSELYSNSIANLGNGAAQITWNNAKDCPLSFVTEDNKQVFIDHFAEYGAWDDLEDWPINELNAIFVQDVSACINEGNKDRIFESDNQYYYYLGL